VTVVLSLPGLSRHSRSVWGRVVHGDFCSLKEVWRRQRPSGMSRERAEKSAFFFFCLVIMLLHRSDYGVCEINHACCWCQLVLPFFFFWSFLKLWSGTLFGTRTRDELVLVPGPAAAVPWTCHFKDRIGFFFFFFFFFVNNFQLVVINIYFLLLNCLDCFFFFFNFFFVPAEHLASHWHSRGIISTGGTHFSWELNFQITKMIKHTYTHTYPFFPQQHSSLHSTHPPLVVIFT
jgi:hypothetical protein